MKEKEVKIKTLSDYFAFLISALMSPYIVATVFIVSMTYNFSENLNQFLPWVLTFMVFATIIPGIYVLWLMETEKIRDIHIADQDERKKPFIIAGVSSVLGAIVLAVLGAAKPVVVVATIYAVIALAVAFITLYWKISIHMALFSSAATVAVVILGPVYAWLYLLLIPLAWSRVHRKRHTIWQAIAGALLAFVLTAAVFWVFNYL